MLRPPLTSVLGQREMSLQRGHLDPADAHAAAAIIGRQAALRRAGGGLRLQPQTRVREDLVEVRSRQNRGDRHQPARKLAAISDG